MFELMTSWPLGNHHLQIFLDARWLLHILAQEEGINHRKEDQHHKNKTKRHGDTSNCLFGTLKHFSCLAHTQTCHSRKGCCANRLGSALQTFFFYFSIKFLEPWQRPTWKCLGPSLLRPSRSLLPFSLMRLIRQRLQTVIEIVNPRNSEPHQPERQSRGRSECKPSACAEFGGLESVSVDGDDDAFSWQVWPADNLMRIKCLCR